jgi:hypothetical protein
MRCQNCHSENPHEKNSALNVEQDFWDLALSAAPILRLPRSSAVNVVPR